MNDKNKSIGYQNTQISCKSVFISLENFIQNALYKYISFYLLQNNYNITKAR